MEDQEFESHSLITTEYILTLPVINCDRVSYLNSLRSGFCVYKIGQ